MMTLETGDWPWDLVTRKNKVAACPSLSLSLFFVLFFFFLVKDLWRVFLIKQTPGSVSLGEQVTVRISKPCLVARHVKEETWKHGCVSMCVCACIHVCEHVYVYMYTLDLPIPMLRALLTLKSSCLDYIPCLCTSNSFKARGTSSRRISFWLKTSKPEYKGLLLCLCLLS